MRTLTLVLLLGSTIGTVSCVRMKTLLGKLENLKDLPNTSSARNLPESEQQRASYILEAADKVELSTKLDCYLYQSSEPRLEVIAPSSERLADLHYEVRERKLVIYDKRMREYGDIEDQSQTHHLAINLYLPGVSELDLSGACTLESKTPWNAYSLEIESSGAASIQADSLNCDHLKLDFSGAAACNLKDVNVNRLDTDLSGAVAITLSGVAGQLTGDFSGAVSADLEQLKSQRASIEASGACSVSVYASESLKGDISGMVSFTYSGNPREVQVEKSGMSSVNKR